MRAFADGQVTFQLTGPGLIVGDNPFSLADSGGVGAIWVRTIPGKVGIVRLEARHTSLGTKDVQINVQRG